MFSRYSRRFRRFYQWISTLHLDVLSAYAAGATLFIIVAFFPFTIILLFCFRAIPDLSGYMNAVRLDFVPESIRQLVLAVIKEIAENSATDILPIAVGTALWSASSGFVSLTRGLNSVYQCRETRPFLIVRLACIIYTILFAALIFLVLVLLVFGNQIFQWMLTEFSALSVVLTPIIEFRSLWTIVVLILFFGMIYKVVPNQKHRFLSEVPGAIVSAFGWFLFSKLYSLYILKIGNRPPVYGSLTAVVFLIIWLYACIFILFIGAQINVLLNSRKRTKEKRTVH